MPLSSYYQSTLGLLGCQSFSTRILWYTPAPKRSRALTIGDRIRERRLALDWSQEFLARRADMSTNTIRLIEQGISESPQISTLVRLAKALGVSIVDLVEDPGHGV